MCKAGVQAYLTKSDQRKLLKEVIIRVSNGEDLCKTKLREIRLSNHDNQTPEDIHRLKPTEKAILILFIQENNLKEIASQLTMTETAVAKTMARLRTEFNVKSNQGLVLLLREEGIL